MEMSHKIKHSQTNILKGLCTISTSTQPTAASYKQVMTERDESSPSLCQKELLNLRRVL